MNALGPNLPVVIQQAGDVSRMQESMQRVGEAQQAAAGAEVAEKQEKERQAISQPEHSDADNRVRADDKSRREDLRRAKKRRKKNDGHTKAAPPDQGGTGLVDVIV